MEQTRRNFLTMIGAGTVAAAGVGGLSRPASAADTVTVLNWQGYGTDEKWALEAFTKKTGIQVVNDYYNAESEMLTKLRTNPGTYDAVVVNSARTKQANTDGLLQEVDLKDFPNASGLSQALSHHDNIVDGGKLYGVAWLWGMNALAYRDTQPKPESYEALADPKYRNKVGLYDDAVSSVALGALMTGQDMNNPKDLGIIRDKLKALKPNVKTIWTSEDQWNKAFSAGDFDIAIYWSGAAVRSKRNFKLPVSFTVPKEGAIGWLDTIAIPATSTRQAAAKAFINYMIDPAFYMEWATKVGAPASANTSAMEALPADDLNRLIHDPKYLATMKVMAPLPDDRRETFNNLWQEVKAFYAS
jgi:spermidine/putrescine transport system substrate-binding protein